MSTKYIVNNVSGQTITGDLTINGSITVTGLSNNIGTYRALLTQTGPIVGTTLNDFDYGLIIGETYTIGFYENGDDFSNVVNVISGGTFIDFDYVWTNPEYVFFTGVTGTTSGLGSGASFNGYWCGATVNSVTINTSGDGYVVGDTITILGTDVNGGTPANDITITVTEVNPNQTGCVFIATGQTPSIWYNGSELISAGNLVVDVLENNLGYDIDWFYNPGEFSGVYIGTNANTGPIYNAFNRNDTYINLGPRTFFYGPFAYDIYGGVSLGFIGNKDDVFFIGVWDTVNFVPIDNSLYYQSFELRVKQDTDSTPIQTYGENVSELPYGNVSVRIYAGSNFIQSFYSDSTTVNNINELVNQLNINSNTNFLGTYSLNEGVENGIILTMATNLKNQFSPNNALTFEVFND
jgi:hypothetical protein